MGKIRSDILN